MKFLWVTIIMLIGVAASAHAQITVEPIDNPQNPVLDQTQLQIFQKLTQLEAKVNTLPTREEVNNISAQTTVGINNGTTENTNQLILVLLIVSLIQVGLFFGIFFWLKGEGKI